MKYTEIDPLAFELEEADQRAAELRERRNQDIARRLASGESQSEVARRYGVTGMTARRVGINAGVLEGKA